MRDPVDRRPLIAAGVLLGAGLGGFVDGIVFHQILQTHSMLSARIDRSTVAGLEINMFWDGIFHAGTWLLTVLGLVLLWRAVPGRNVSSETGTLIGAVMLGWGLFNLVEGVINHHLLHLHHVVEAPNHLLADLLFLGFGLFLIGGGVWLLNHYSVTSRVPEERTGA